MEKEQKEEKKEEKEEKKEKLSADLEFPKEALLYIMYEGN